MADLKPSQKSGNDTDTRPLTNVVPYSAPFLNGTSELMKVNGSVTPVNFVVAPGANQTFYVTSVSLYIEDGDNPTIKEFGNLAPLVNGIQLIYKRDNVEYVLHTLKYNMDLMLTYPHAALIGVDKGWTDNPDNYRGTVQFPSAIRLDAALGDSLFFKIQDNLTGLAFFEARASYFISLDP
jgi:hypothetical protein